MEISGPFFDHAKKRSGRNNCWYLRYSAPRTNPDGSFVRKAGGKIVLQRHRPYYESRKLAEADKPRIQEQFTKTGVGEFLFNRAAAEDYEAALKRAGGVPMLELANFWRLHHPEKPKRKLAELFNAFLEDLKIRNVEGRHYNDVKSRGITFIKSGFGTRYPETVTRQEILTYVREMQNTSSRGVRNEKVSPRTMRNHKTAICIFFNWLVQDAHELQSNPAAGIKKRMLPKDTAKEIEFLSLDQVTRYLRTLERYDPELGAHEIVQLIAGVRADDEMADFDRKFVLPVTKEIVIPAEVAKTEKREVLDGLEDNFWAWWAEYAPKRGLLRPKNYEPRWNRIRVLASIENAEKADELARLPIKHLLRMPTSKATLKKWPWNARRRTFCTFHVAKHQSAAKTALIMRHRGSAYTLHNSYRGLGVSKEQGEAYFQILPAKLLVPIRPVMPDKGIIRLLKERRLSQLKSDPAPLQSRQGQPA